MCRVDAREMAFGMSAVQQENPNRRRDRLDAKQPRGPSRLRAKGDAPESSVPNAAKMTES